MRPKLTIIAAVILFAAFTSCGGKETAASLGKKWCDLNGKAFKATGEAKEKAEKALNDYETELQNKYKNDQAFLKEIEKETEKCEDASEGR